MMRSMFAGVAGLRVHQTKMDVIGNNIANVNTIGFKKSRVNFQEMLNQTLRSSSAPQGNKGGINPMQIGLGVQLGSIDVLHIGGSPQATGRNLDMSIEGDGYFVIGSGANKYYTRAGNFDFDSNNNLVTVNGMNVLGWTTDPTTLRLDTSEEARPISLGALAETQVQRATSQIQIGRNLDSRTLAQDLDLKAFTATNVMANQPTPFTIKLPKGVVFNEEFNIGGNIDYATLMDPNNTGKWSINPTTGELKILDNNFYTGQTIINEVQRINLGSLTTGDTFTLNFDGQTSVDIDLNVLSTADDIANAIQAALVGLSNIDAGDVSVVADNGQFVVTFMGNLAGLDVTDIVVTPGAGFIPGSTPTVGEDIPGQTINNTVAIGADPIISYREAAHQTPITIYDSLGKAHEASVIYYKSDDNKWLANVTINGELVRLNNSPGSEYIHEIEFTEIGQIKNGRTLNIEFTNNNPFGSQVDPLTATLDFSSLTQVATDTTALGLSQDGFEPGSLQSVAVDNSGNIIGTFSNGQNLLLAQVALATFRNPAGLINDGNTMFRESRNSGIAQVGTPGSANRGIVKPETLEMSNVDLSQEFVEMITTQRGFQANSRIITTSDELLQELVNLKR